MGDERAMCRATVVVPDAGVACAYLGRVLGAEPIDEPDRALAADGAARLQSVGLGDMVLEFVEPTSPASYWRTRLERSGPSVVSLAVEVEDTAAARHRLDQEGIVSHVTAEGRIIGESMARIGFDVELVARSAGTTAASGKARWGRVSPMLHVEITHEDIAAASMLLERLFGSRTIETKFSSFLASITGGRMGIRHVNLGDAMVLQYIQPRHDAGPWWDQLQRRGASVHNITWLVDDMPAVAAASAAAGTSDLRYFEFNYDRLFGVENRIGEKTIGRIIDAAAITGFHIELSEPQATNINEFFFKTF